MNLKLASSIMVILACSILACGAAEDDDGAGGNTSTASTGTVGKGVTCGDATCQPNEYCVPPVGMCAAPPICQPAPLPDEEKVVCGCDGLNHKNAYLASFAGGVSKDGPCDPPGGKFTCIYEYQVPIYCDAGTTYCKLTMTANVYGLECAELPNGCTPQKGNCECLNDGCSANYCAVDANANATVLCMQ